MFQKEQFEKTAEVTGDLIDNKIADKITSVSKPLTHSKNDGANSEIEIQKKIHISRRKTTDYWWIKISITI